ncbi:MAG: glycosyltransferase family 2 protein [Deltaproteobacteria bacterium]|nr:glycosyltransferase family 2 protein [Deltaproteobacteria bacterium]
MAPEPILKSITTEATQLSGEPLEAFHVRPQDFLDWLFGILILSSLVFLVYTSITGGLFNPLIEAIQTDSRMAFIVRPTLLWASMGSLFVVFRTILWFHYRPFPPAVFNDAPPLTVIIPAYNEGPMVEKAIHSVLAADYPRDRLEVLVVDDGSRDDTWYYIKRVAKLYPQQVTAVRFPANKGKREALSEGFNRARGEVVVTVDSDSVITKGTLLAMTGPFRDPAVGAVAGKVKAYNLREGIIPRMLHVRYVLSFDFLRAVQSTYRTVYCCPGALAAYRVGAVRRVLEQWRAQTFMGAPCTYGEDRALTNYMLSLGYDSVYQGSAEVHTVVPQSYKKLTRMYLRWDRSHIRETFHFIRIVWKRPFWPCLVSLFDTFITNLRYPVTWFVLGLLVYRSLQNPGTMLRVFLAIGIFSLLNSLYYLYSERRGDFWYNVVYAYFAFLTLFWVFPYALLTVRSKSWMTR